MESDGWRIVSNHGQWQIVSLRTKQTTPLYEGMHRLICKLAWQYSRRCMLPVQDLISEGYAALLLADGKYDPDRAARSTFVYWVVRNHFCQLAQRWPIMLDVPEHLAHDPLPALESAHEFRSAISLLSNEAKQVIKILLDSPKELMDIAKGSVPERLQNAVVKMLRRRGWGRDQVQSIMVEIKSVVQNYNR